MPETSTVMITKVLLPSKQPGLLHRQRLVDFIHEHIVRKLILVSASAGYGKTSLLVDFAHETDLPVCWYSVDEADRDPRVFLEYLIASIRQQFPDFGSRTKSALSTVAKADGQLRTLVIALINDIHDVPDYFVVIIDDYHFVDESQEVNTLVDGLLRYLPENCHLIVSSRTLPHLTFSRLIARQESAGLGTAELRFTAAEIQTLLKQAHHLDIPDEQAQELARESEGWITGILLTTHTIWQGLVRSMVQARGAGGQMYDYLADNVLGEQAPGIQRFLKDSSILREISPALCDALLNSRHSLEMLRVIEKRNLFISRLEGDEPWYRYHHLFQKFLQEKLRLEEPERFDALHCRAAEVLRRMGNHEEAIRHYKEAGAYAETAEVIQQVAEATFKAGRWETLAGWIDALPDEITRSNPELLWFRARVYTEVGRLSQALASFDLARTGFQRQSDKAGVSRVLVRRAIALRLSGRVEEAIKDCQAVISDLDGHHPSIVAIAHRNLGICYGMQGDYHKSATELEKALQLYERCGDDYDVALIRHDLSVAHWGLGHLARADLELERAIEYWRREGNAGGRLAMALNNAGFGQHCRGRYGEALETLEEALVVAREAGYLRGEATTLTSLGDVYRDLGDLSRALELYRQALKTARQADEAIIETYALSAMSEAHRLAGELDKAWDLARASLAASQMQRLSFHAGLAQLSLGVIYYERGEAQEALRWLEKARQKMERSGVKHELARVHFHLAQAHFLRKEFQSARRHLLQLLALTDELGYDQFIAVEARRARPLLQYAASRRVGGDRFVRLMEKIEEIPTKGEISPPRITTPSPFPQLEIRALGTPQVLNNGIQIGKKEWRRPMATELFFYLLAHPAGQPREQITDVFWPDLPPGRAQSAFHSTVYRLRRATHMEILTFDRNSDTYGLNPEARYWYDVEEFEQLLEAAPGSGESRAEALRQAIALYRGEYMERFYSDWCLPKRRRLEKRYLDALSELARWCMDEGSYDEALELCEKALQTDDYREEMYRLMMKCYSLLGQLSQVIQVYQRCVKVLGEDLGMEPSAETVTLYQELMAER